MLAFQHAPAAHAHYAFLQIIEAFYIRANIATIFWLERLGDQYKQTAV